MEQTLTNFIRALRSAGSPVSPSEAIDAARTVSLVGYDDRQLLKNSLGTVIAKSEEEKATFERLFELYFARQPSQETSDQETGKSDDAASGDIQSEMSSAAENFLQMAQPANAEVTASAIEAAAASVGANNIRFSTQIGYFTQRILEELGVRELERELIDRLTARTEEAEREAETLMAARDQLRRLARDQMERRFEIFGRSATETFMDEVMANKPMRALDRRDMERMKRLIKKMAKRLAVKYGRRQKKKNRGQINLRKTLRANAGYDGVPFQVVWKQKKRERPKIVAVCDVSGSVSDYVRFLLLFLYTLNETVRDIQCYAFSHRLRPVTSLLETHGYETAMEVIMKDLGAGATDYGQALSDLKTYHWPELDRRTTLLVLGDARSNDADPRVDIFKEAAGRVKQVVWLCPEHPRAWGTGDSCMLQYKPFCRQLSHCTSASDLERVIDEMLSVYAR